MTSTFPNLVVFDMFLWESIGIFVNQKGAVMRNVWVTLLYEFLLCLLYQVAFPGRLLFGHVIKSYQVSLKGC